jgi:tripartite ATP-independent transporter DctP family solute receptor
MTLSKGFAAGLLGMAAVLTAMPSAAKEYKFAIQDSPASIIYKGIDAMKAEVAKLSAGEVTYAIFPSEQLGGLQAIIDQVREGEIDFTAVGYPDMSYLIPELKLIGEPYVVKDYDHLLRIAKGPYGQKMDAAFNAKGVRVLDIWYGGTRQTTSNKPIKAIADMKGLKLRTPNVDFLIDFATAAGAKAVPVAFQEVYLALKTNQVDAQENPLPTIDTMKFYEVQSHVALTNHFVASKAIVVSEKTWQGLNEKQRAAVVQAAATARKINNDMMFKQEAELLDGFQKRGITITKPDTAPFRDAMRPFYKKLEDKFGAGTIDALIKQ